MHHLVGCRPCIHRHLLSESYTATSGEKHPRAPAAAELCADRCAIAAALGVKTVSVHLGLKVGTGK